LLDVAVRAPADVRVIRDDIGAQVRARVTDTSTTRKPSCCSCVSTTPAARRSLPAGSGTWPETGYGCAPPAPNRASGSTRWRYRRWPRSASTSPATRHTKLDWELAEGNDVVVSMGCGDACPYVPGTRYDDWNLTDPTGQPIEVVREVRDRSADTSRHCWPSCYRPTADRDGRARSGDRRQRRRELGRVRRRPPLAVVPAAWTSAAISSALKWMGSADAHDEPARPRHVDLGGPPGPLSATAGQQLRPGIAFNCSSAATPVTAVRAP
jgi:hypothetical protein